MDEFSRDARTWHNIAQLFFGLRQSSAEHSHQVAREVWSKQKYYNTNNSSKEVAINGSVSSKKSIYSGPTGESFQV